MSLSPKFTKSYRFNEEWTLDLVAYAWTSEDGQAKESASFFVFTIQRNQQIWFSDILSDLMGEIQMDLQGFEEEGQVRVWGHVYPYFEKEYGKI